MKNQYKNKNLTRDFYSIAMNDQGIVKVQDNMRGVVRLFQRGRDDLIIWTDPRGPDYGWITDKRNQWRETNDRDLLQEVRAMLRAEVEIYLRVNR